MNVYALLGAVEIGLVYGVVACGVFLSFRVLNFPDLTVDGSFPLGAAVTATLLISGINPWAATALALVGGLPGRDGDGFSQRPLRYPQPACQHPDDDRALHRQPAHHGGAQPADSQSADGHDALRGDARPPLPATVDGRYFRRRRPAAALSSAVLRSGAGAEGHRGQPPNGRRQRHFDQRHDLFGAWP